MAERNFWGLVTAGNAMSGMSFRVEFPAWGPDHSVRFNEQVDALKFAREWAAEDKMLVLVWDMGAGMYIQRYDGREKVCR